MTRSALVPVVAAATAAGLALSVGAESTKRLRVVNGCPTEPLWIAHIAAGGTGPDQQDVKIEPLQHFDFTTSDGLAATRYWPKMRCDAAGGNCDIGDSGGPGEACVRHGHYGDDYSHCAPPVDTKFEASFGIFGEPCNPQAPGGTEMKGCDYVDISLVDGFTLPVKLEISDGVCKDSNDDSVVEEIDCSGLSLDACPTAETLSGADVSLQAVNPSTGDIVGCYGPCLRLIDDKWSTPDQSLDSNMYCCPTPPVSPEECRSGPIASTEYLQLVHSKCQGAYGYAYDDSTGLLRCDASSIYTLTFYCPSDATASAQSTPSSPTLLLRGSSASKP